MKKYIVNIIILILCVMFATLRGSCADIDFSKGFVSDKAHIFDQRLYNQLNDILKNLHNETGNDVIVITMNIIPPRENYSTIETQVKKNYILGGINHDKWVMVILTTNPYRMNIRVGKGLKKIITGATVRAMNFEFLFSRINNMNGDTLTVSNAARDLYNTTMFLAELVADKNNARLHTSAIEAENETVGDILYVLGGADAQNIPLTDPTEKYIRRNNFHMVIAILAIGFLPLGIIYRHRKKYRRY